MQEAWRERFASAQGSASLTDKRAGIYCTDIADTRRRGEHAPLSWRLMAIMKENMRIRKMPALHLVQTAPLVAKGRFKKMFKKINIIRKILRHKNSQIRAEREKTQAEQSMNVILSAYLAMLIDRRGTVTIPKKEISEILGRYRVMASSDDENYVITVTPNEYDIGRLRGEE
jgi:hypothetical protein